MIHSVEYRLQLDKMPSPLAASAPASPKRDFEPEARPLDAIKRSNSCIEGKYKCTITSDRLVQLRKVVEDAVRDHKVFTIKGGWAVIRRELLKRKWIEKYEPTFNRPKATQPPNSDDLVSNLPAKQDWESPTAYTEKCEKTIMSRMLQNYDVDFYWNMRKDQSDLLHRSNSYKIMNRFNKSLFASKEGLALLLQQHYWYTEPSVASLNFPRCFVLGFPDHYAHFVDDFRMTASMGILKWFVKRHDSRDHPLQSPDGTIPLSAIQFAINQCTNFIEIRKHNDIDKDYPRVFDHEWDEFLSHYYGLVHQRRSLAASGDHCLAGFHTKANNVLNEISKHWTDYAIDGHKNIWILKPGNKCRGRGIQLVKNLADVEKVVSLKLKYVVQKYIERPLLIHNTKFDIRQWFLVTNAQPLTIWMYRECYLRFSGQVFTLENFHESLHLTNHAVQCRYKNGEQRDKALPSDNMWDSNMFQAYLKTLGVREKFEEVIQPGMREGIVCAMLASQEMMDRRQNTFELYGADFMVSEDFRPWLIEINCSPDLSPSTSVTSRMCPQCVEDLVKVVVDKRRDPSAITGMFDLIYRQTLPRIPPYLGMNLSIRGRKIFRSRYKSTKGDSSKDCEFVLPKRKDLEIRRCETAPPLPKITTPRLYKGPIIEDLIDNLNKAAKRPNDLELELGRIKPSNNSKAERDAAKKKKAENGGPKRERVAKKLSSKLTINKLNFVSRKQNANENLKSDVKLCNDTYYLGLFNEWTSKCSKSTNDVMKQIGWERKTVSILKSKNILGGRLDEQKNCVKRKYCFNLDVGNLLPQINDNCHK